MKRKMTEERKYSDTMTVYAQSSDFVTCLTAKLRITETSASNKITSINSKLEQRECFLWIKLHVKDSRPFPCHSENDGMDAMNI